MLVKNKSLVIESLVMAGVLFLSASVCHAVDIQFPEEELAKESVYPVFDNPEPVKRRNVVTAGHFEVGVFGGWTLNDALADPMNFSGSGTYHFNEFHAFEVQGGFFSTKPSQYVPDIEQAAGASGDVKNLAYAPAAKYFILGNYQITPYYGKISITKQTVFNLSIFGTLGAGTIKINDESSFVLAFGLGQKIFFGKNWGIRADLRALLYQAPNGLSKPIPNPETPPNSFFKKQSVTNGMLSVGLIYIL